MTHMRMREEQQPLFLCRAGAAVEEERVRCRGADANSARSW